MYDQARLLQQPPDVEILHPGDTIPATIGPILKAAGWRGGLFVKYVNGNMDFIVEQSDGNEACGFIVLQSEDYQDPPGSPENFTAYQYKNPLSPSVMTLMFGNARGYFKIFETEALNAGVRNGGPITYVLNQNLKISENGLLCNDSDVELALAGVTTPVVVGIVSAVPATRNGDRLGCDMRF